MFARELPELVGGIGVTHVIPTHGTVSRRLLTRKPFLIYSEIFTGIGASHIVGFRFCLKEFSQGLLTNYDIVANLQDTLFNIIYGFQSPGGQIKLLQQMHIGILTFDNKHFLVPKLPTGGGHDTVTRDIRVAQAIHKWPTIIAVCARNEIGHPLYKVLLTSYYQYHPRNAFSHSG